jgi:muramoyltetrapeptide carboxypeptidase
LSYPDLRRGPLLKAGAGIALTAPAGPLSAGSVERAIRRVRSWGWRPLLGEHATRRAGFLAGDDHQRAADLNRAIRDLATDAVWCLRGGYGTMRLLDAVEWDAWAERALPFIGFSDNTALHLALRRRGVVSLHGPHAGAAELSAFAERCLREVLTSPIAAGTLPFPAGARESVRTLRPGVAEGPLVGGNLALLAATLGTPFAIRAEGAIVFLEEIGEAPYRVDRMLTQLRLAGVLDRAAGVAIGAFSGCDGVDGADAAEVVAERCASLGVPVLAGLPFGHVAESWTLPLGVPAHLDATAGTLALLEPALGGGGTVGTSIAPEEKG